MTRVLIVTASIGEGHDLPARVLARALAAAGAEAEIADGLAAMGPVLAAAAGGGAQRMSYRLAPLLDLEYLVFARTPPVRAAGRALLSRLGAEGMLRLVAGHGPDVVVSTYPATTEVLGWLRERRRLAVPVVSAITDLAALHYWSHPGVDLHLITHPESAHEVRSIAGPRARIVAVRGLYEPAMLAPIDPAAARTALGLPAAGSVVCVSGGGWGVGDLDGGVAAALGAGADRVVALCGRNDAVRARLERRWSGEPRVRAEGFTERMSEHLAAADVLVHSSAGLTVLEGLARGCRVISYGWNVAHVRLNNRAYERHGLAAVARSRRELDAALARALAEPARPDPTFAALPEAADVVLERER